MFDDNDFDAADAAVFGGILGFVEESMQREEEGEDDSKAIEEAIDDYLTKSPKTSIHLLYNENPMLVRHLIKRAHQSRRRAYDKITEQEVQEVQKEMREEIAEQDGEEKWKVLKNSS